LHSIETALSEPSQDLQKHSLGTLATPKQELFQPQHTEPIHGVIA